MNPFVNSYSITPPSTPSTTPRFANRFMIINVGGTRCCTPKVICYMVVGIILLLIVAVAAGLLYVKDAPALCAPRLQLPGEKAPRCVKECPLQDLVTPQAAIDYVLDVGIPALCDDFVTTSLIKSSWGKWAFGKDKPCVALPIKAAYCIKD